MNLEHFMRMAINEAEQSLREGNKGFGAVIVYNGECIASAHDLEETNTDPTSHAEINAIKIASKKIGKKLDDCILISTHEPCPMCAFAIAWSGIKEMAYGYGIDDAIAQGRNRIEFNCDKAFNAAKRHIKVHKGVLKDECSTLYRADVRNEINRLRKLICSNQTLSACNDTITKKIKEDFIASDNNWPIIQAKRILNIE